MEFIGPALFILIPVFGIALIALVAVAISSEARHGGKGEMVRSAYFYGMSLMSLAIVIGATVYLANEGLSAWVFTRAQQPTILRQGPPPSLYFSDLRKEVPVGPTTYSCTDQCDLPEDAKTQVTAWQTQYAEWSSAVANNSRQRRNIVNALSFLIVAVPVFFLHYRIVRRDRDSEDKRTIRSTYFYGLSLISLLMVIASVGFLVNLGLNEWISPGENPNRNYYPTPIQVTAEETSGVTSVANCQDKCDLSTEVVAAAAQWPKDYQAYQQASQNGVSSKHQTAAAMLSLLLVAAPVFWYHFTGIRKKKESVTPLT